MSDNRQLDTETNKKKRTRPGRSSRRRKRKAQAILDAAAASLCSSSTSDGADVANRQGDSATATGSSNPAVPSDRGYALEGVKARRREERKRRLQSQSAPQDVSAGDGQADEQEDGDDAQLDPIDEHALRLQRGFIPGNAVCVAARLSSELNALFEILSSKNSIEKEDVDAKLNDDDAIEGDEVGDYLGQPTVLKLYPMVIRESYHGGKTDGRAFKGRKRGAMRVEGGKQQNDEAEADGSSKKNKKERAWLVGPSTKTDTITLDDETPSTDEPTNQKQSERDQQCSQSKQIIEPFPTLYWLTSPLLRTQISKLEISKTHNVPSMEARLRSSPAYIEQMKLAHKSYGQKRWELLTPQDQTNVIERGWKSALDDSRGVAGIRLKNDRYDCVKCLHAHAAHYLAQVAEWAHDERKDEGEDCQRDDLNLVGKWTMEAVFDALSNNIKGSE